ncbi:MAG: diadenylate cyclase CdaA [Lachnospiraceae bacterium]|nr:diadenylate cyclase CdaA [Lachnospiraceae bacterium]
MQDFLEIIRTFANESVKLPKIDITDIVEIIIISYLFYHIMVWIKNTRAWTLIKGLAILLIFTLFALVFELNTIIWIAENTLGIGVIAIVVMFQPELRKALEQLGRKNILKGFIPFDDTKNTKERFTDNTVLELVRAVFALAKTKTGALIVIEQDSVLSEYVNTGISIDAIISSQLLINIFEHNTPLHDGAVIIRGDRVVAATCYLPLSDNMEISKELGTRHRAGLGVSELTDSLTLIVSEETGKVSIAFAGQLFRNIDSENLRNKLIRLQNKTIDAKRFRIWKGKSKNEKEVNQ